MCHGLTELSAGAPARTPALPTDDSSSGLPPQPGPGASEHTGHAGGRASPTRRASRRSTGRGAALPRRSLTRAACPHGPTPPKAGRVRPRRRPGRAERPRGTARRAGSAPCSHLAGRSQWEPQAARGGSATHSDTITSLLPGRRAAAARRSAPQPSPTGVQGGPGAAARSQWLGRGGRERRRAGSTAGSLLRRRSLRGLIGPGRALPPCDRAGAQLGRVKWWRRGPPAAAPQSFSLGFFDFFFFSPPSSAFGTFQTAAPR